MNFKKAMAANVTILSILALAGATAEADMINHPDPAPGPAYVPITPYYYDEHHTDHDYNYWQSIHDGQVKAKEDREHDLALRRAEADRLMHEDAQHMAPAR